MKNLAIETTNGNNVNVELDFRSQPSGHGHYKIFCDVNFLNNKKTFTKTTDNMLWIDSLADLKSENPSWEAINEFYFEKFGDFFEEQINEWIDLILEN